MTAFIRGLLGKFRTFLSRNHKETTVVVGIATILVAIGSVTLVVVGINEQRKASAWQVINAQRCGNSGTKEALEFLHREGVHIRKIDFGWTAECGDSQSLYLSEIDLSSATLGAIEWKYVDLSDANLRKALMREATLESVNLVDSTMAGADLRSVRFDDVNLFRANLIEAKLLRAEFEDTRLTDTDLSKADMKDVLMVGIELQRATLSRANLRGADLRRADLKLTDMRNADMTGADLRGAQMLRARLEGANLSAAKFKGAEGISAEGAWAWEDTRPSGLPLEELSRVRLCDPKLREDYEKNDHRGEPVRKWAYGTQWWHNCEPD